LPSIKKSVSITDLMGERVDAILEPNDEKKLVGDEQFLFGGARVD
jgi:hypothetical protein